MSFQIITSDRLESLLARKSLSNECGYCFRGLKHVSSILYLCASCGEAYCSCHFCFHSLKYPHSIAFALTSTSQNKLSSEESSKKVKTNSSIDVDLVTMVEDRFIPFKSSDIPGELFERISEIFSLHDFSVIIFSSESNQMPPCEHLLNAEFNTFSIDSIERCSEELCDVSSGLWSCLTCSKISCGRKQFDGSGGNGHALEHWENCLHPLAIRLGTLRSKCPEIYCYACDQMVSPDEKLSAQLSAISNTDSVSTLKREQSLLELEQIHSSTIGADGDDGTLKKISASNTNSVGLKNLGNSCYISVILQILFQDFKFLLNEGHFYQCFKNPNSCIECQILKIALALSNDQTRYSMVSEISPISFRRLLMEEMPLLTKNSSQQDAAEFFQAFLSNLLSKMDSFKPFKYEAFAPLIKSILECGACGKQNTTTVSEEYSPLMIVPRANSSISKEISKYFEKSASEEESCSACSSPFPSRYQCLSSKTYPQFILIQLYVFGFDNNAILKHPLDVSSFAIDSEFSSDILRVQLENGLSPNDIPNMAELLSLGFSELQIKKAIENVSHPENLELVVDWICSNPPDENEITANQVSSSSDKNVAFLNEIYELSAIVCHRGQNVHCGHYYVIKKVQPNNWLLFDDERVFKVEDATFYYPSAYLLLYSKNSINK